ncbi:YtxH domain-containing protein [Bacillus suaedae]|uniref:YtxH domain-containing protein n=1 Tax=Halalkalibacter suaedae TaxID=2822140 RepID=A0A940WZ90_9BACI|nr:YtxH domain-containing protein [Bacillus suaedae]MBP3951450.1 YtxH domain-containing protein [Bacillus suaedae]
MKKSLVTGFITGSIISGALTLLTTPTSGKDIQYRFRKNMTNLSQLIDQFHQSTLTTSDQFKATLTVSKDQFKAVGKETSQSIHKWKQDIEPNLSQLKADLNALQENIEKSKDAL